MRRQRGLPASHVPLMLLWNKPQVTEYLANRVSIPAQPFLPLAGDYAMVGQQQMQAWWEHLWPNPRTHERLRPHAFADKEHTVILRALLKLACAVLTLLRCPLRSSQQGEATLCQR